MQQTESMRRLEEKVVAASGSDMCRSERYAVLLSLLHPCNPFGPQQNQPWETAKTKHDTVGGETAVCLFHSGTDLFADFIHTWKQLMTMMAP